MYKIMSCWVFVVVACLFSGIKSIGTNQKKAVFQGMVCTTSTLLFLLLNYIF